MRKTNGINSRVSVTQVNMCIVLNCEMLQKLQFLIISIVVHEVQTYS